MLWLLQSSRTTFWSTLPLPPLPFPLPPFPAELVVGFGAGAAVDAGVVAGAAGVVGAVVGALAEVAAAGAAVLCELDEPDEQAETPSASPAARASTPIVRPVTR
jgi:hypothetical protein